ncbi:MAG: class I SAM-dependent methyltransferase [Acidobacteriota bacterium]|nr:class I SAM-dependent methyltransferase [Acidobacteriota bacterium]
MYRCPACRGALTEHPDSLRCDSCLVGYPVVDRVTDFARGAYYDQFDENTILTEEHRHALEREVEGAIARIRDFYGPLIEKTGQSLRILDAGCGNGISVDLLLREGHDAWGIDASSLRRWQWREREHRDHLAVGDGAKLPFPDDFFTVLLCSGVLEHIGVEESGGDKYRVHPLPDRDAARRSFLTSLLRVLAPGGVLYLDFPNGAFPIDFWHNTRGGSARFHSLREGFLPTFDEVKTLAEQIDPAIRVEPVSPNRRLRFQQVKQHWYGHIFATPMRLLFSAMDIFPRLARTPMNPFLVIRLTKPAARQAANALL